MCHTPSAFFDSTESSPFPFGPRIGMTRFAEPSLSCVSIPPVIHHPGFNGVPIELITQGEAPPASRVIRYASDERIMEVTPKNRETRNTPNVVAPASTPTTTLAFRERAGGGI